MYAQINRSLVEAENDSLYLLISDYAASSPVLLEAIEE